MDIFSLATDFTDGLALKALKSIFTYLPRAYNDGANDPVAITEA